MKHHRKEKIEKELHRVISKLISTELRDPRIGFTTLSKVEVSTDLLNAKIFVTVFAAKEKIDETINILNKASGFIQGRLSDETKLRYIPAVKFFFDKGLENAHEIDKIIKETKADSE